MRVAFSVLRMKRGGTCGLGAGPRLRVRRLSLLGLGLAYPRKKSLPSHRTNHFIQRM
jgi:hypothetical protein